MNTLQNAIKILDAKDNDDISLFDNKINQGVIIERLEQTVYYRRMMEKYFNSFEKLYSLVRTYN